MSMPGSDMAALDRRQFLVTTGVVAGGMALAITPANAATGAAPPPPWGPDAAQGYEFTPWIEIAADDTVTVRVPNPESGNGTMTLKQIQSYAGDALSDEVLAKIDVDLAAIK